MDEIIEIGKSLGYKGEYTYLRYEKIASILNKLGSGTILNIGCGFGIFDHYLSERFKVLGIDSERKEIEKAKELGKKFSRYFEYKLTDAMEFKTNEKFDFVLCSELLEHLKDDSKFIEKLKHFVKPGGYVLITVPNIQQLRNRFRGLFGLKPIFMDRTHLREYTRKEIETLIENSGLDVLEMHRIVIYFPFENIIKVFIRPRSRIRRSILRLLPDAASHFIYLCKAKGDET